MQKFISGKKKTFFGNKFTEIKELWKQDQTTPPHLKLFFSSKTLKHNAKLMQKGSI